MGRPQAQRDAVNQKDSTVNGIACGWRAQLQTDKNLRRVLVLKWSALGDLAIATSAFEDIAVALPECELHLNTLPQWTRLFEHDARFTRVWAQPVRQSPGRVAHNWRWLRTAISERYDAVIDLQSSDHSRLLIALLTLCSPRLRYRIGTHRKLPFNVAPAQPNGPPSAQERGMATLECAGIPATTTAPMFGLAPEQRQQARELCARHRLREKRFVVFFPGCQAAGYLKRWGASRYAALARRLHEHGIERIALVGGPDEMDECTEITDRAGAYVVNLCGQTDILDIVPISEMAMCIVGNDTGTAHIAAASATPMTVICGPTDPRRVKPVGDAVKTLQASLPCINCYAKHCAHHSCMALITPAAVQATLPSPPPAEES